jgi:hypothetical protein
LHEEAERRTKIKNFTLDMNDIVRRAKVLSLNRSGETQAIINLSHLNPDKNKKVPKLQLEKRQKEA